MKCVHVSAFLLFITIIHYCSATIRFDKVSEEDKDDKSSSEATPVPVKRSKLPFKATRLKLTQSLRNPLNRPRRDHQYATYKVPKNHVLAGRLINSNLL